MRRLVYIALGLFGAVLIAGACSDPSDMATTNMPAPNVDPAEPRLLFTQATGGTLNATCTPNCTGTAGWQTTLTATPTDGYAFLEWSIQSPATGERTDPTNPLDLRVYDLTHIAAFFAPITTITLERPAVGGTAGLLCNQFIQSETQCDFIPNSSRTFEAQARPADGYRFVRWECEPNCPFGFDQSTAHNHAPFDDRQSYRLRPLFEIDPNPVPTAPPAPPREHRTIRYALHILSDLPTDRQAARDAITAWDALNPTLTFEEVDADAEQLDLQVRLFDRPIGGFVINIDGEIDDGDAGFFCNDGCFGYRYRPEQDDYVLNAARTDRTLATREVDEVVAATAHPTPPDFCPTPEWDWRRLGITTFLLAHELGHFLGLQHTTAPNHLMTAAQGTPTPDDLGLNVPILGGTLTLVPNATTNYAGRRGIGFASFSRASISDTDYLHAEFRYQHTFARIAQIQTQIATLQANPSPIANTIQAHLTAEQTALQAEQLTLRTKLFCADSLSASVPTAGDTGQPAATG